LHRFPVEPNSSPETGEFKNFGTVSPPPEGHDEDKIKPSSRRKPKMWRRETEGHPAFAAGVLNSAIKRRRLTNQAASRQQDFSSPSSAEAHLTRPSAWGTKDLSSGLLPMSFPYVLFYLVSNQMVIIDDLSFSRAHRIINYS